MSQNKHMENISRLKLKDCYGCERQENCSGVCELSSTVLKKKICARCLCIDTTQELNSFINNWERGYVKCKESPIFVEVKKIPDKCPYRLEHIVYKNNYFSW